MSNGLRIAVTGGSGMVGSAVLRELVARGHTAINLDRRAPWKPVEGVRFCYVDLRHREQVQSILEGVDAVCHLGEIPNSSAPISPDELFYTNTRIGSVVMQTAADLRLRHAVYTSSCQVYGTWGAPPVPPKYLPIDSAHPTQPQNQYALSKVANESYARWVSAALGLSVSIFRLPMVLSSFRHQMAMRFEHEDFRSHEMNTYVHATDAAIAYALAVEKALPGCETYTLVADDVLMPEPLAPYVQRHFPDWPQLPVDWPAQKSPVSSANAKEKLGWLPKYDFREDYRKIRGREPLFRA
jgi:nucleoside-diphosphate-sugar epimerase